MPYLETKCWWTGTDSTFAGMIDLALMHVWVQAVVASWNQPPITAGGVVKYHVDLTGAKLGDIASVSLTSVDATHSVLLSATAQTGSVTVVIFNAGQTPVDLPAGQLRVAIAAFV